MRNIALTVLASVAVAALATPASASVSVTYGNQTVNGGTDVDNILIPADQVGSTVHGTTQPSQGSLDVTFKSLNSDSLFTASSNGQAIIKTTENPSSLETLMFYLTAGGGFTNFEFNLEGSLSSLQNVVLTTNLGTHTYTDYSSNGSNWVGAAADGEYFTSVSFSASGAGYTDLKQPRIGGIVAPVPEPSTWAMMLVGFGAAGYSMRRRNAKVALQTA